MLYNNDQFCDALKTLATTGDATQLDSFMAGRPADEFLQEAVAWLQAELLTQRERIHQIALQN